MTGSVSVIIAAIIISSVMSSRSVEEHLKVLH